ncbi:hypothetical protein BEWA_039700 [Theileria equi strain WA]|uniref:Uncharacterized protein n=1 Tax=Theileria equi strain WA TaxID=1537102 RepID=L1LER5_THEEQ|nr:hypothetical protein BEWA_039700 [Theileria equi strain WA]EKX73932.1 hypothetical protein BEWA_039700 [Theileria equi strain WA]|eukprot:XP_004833384.1 hypothetical protein BEWA_039700 [Theileria equi strain WA]
MFQVTEVQPLIVDVLDLLDEIPQSAMSKILEDTTSSQHFYKIATANIKRKIWAASAERLFEIIEPIISKSLFLLQLGILDRDTQEHPYTVEHLREYNILISQIVNIIGDPQGSSSRRIYQLIVHLLKLLFIKSTLGTRHDLYFKKQEHNDEAEVGGYSLDMAYAQVGLCSRHDSNADTFASTEHTESAKHDVTYNPCQGQYLLSTIRYSIATKYQEHYRVDNAQMLLIEPKFLLLQLIHATHNAADNKLPSELIKPLLTKIKDGKGIGVKDDADLFDISFVLSNPLLCDKIVAYFINCLLNMNMMFLAFKNDMNDWMSILSLGLSSSYIGVIMFILNAKESGKDGEYITFLNPYITVKKPVSLKKILSYIFPEKAGSSDVLPPFFHNFVSSLKGETVSDSELSAAFHKIRDVCIDDVQSFLENAETAFHSLLVLYLPKMDTLILNNYKSNFMKFLESVQSNIEDSQVKDKRFDSEFLLAPFYGKKYKSIEYINKLSSVLDKHLSTLERSSSKRLCSGIGNLNVSLLLMVMKRFSFLGVNIMGALCSTCNITAALLKMEIVELFNVVLNGKKIVSGEERSGSLYKLRNTFEKACARQFGILKVPMDYTFLKLLRTCLLKGNVTHELLKYVEGISNLGLPSSFLLLYYYKIYELDKHGKMVIDRLYRSVVFRVYSFIRVDW